jgi:hypothetical protein
MHAYACAQIQNGASTLAEIHPSPKEASASSGGLAQAQTQAGYRYEDVHTSMSELHKAFTNVKPWCQPWPACVRDF